MNTFRYLIIWLAVALSAIAGADTVQQKLDALNAKSGVVLAAWIEVTPRTMGRSPLHLGTIAWIQISGDHVTSKSADIIVANMGVVGQEAAYWVGGTPEPLRGEDKFLSSRTTGGWAALTRAQQISAIQSFCNGVYKAAVAGARDIRDFQVEPVDGNTIRVSGYFNTGQGLTQWERQSWFVRLIDPNGSVAAPYSNVEFQRVVEPAQ